MDGDGCDEEDIRAAGTHFGVLVAGFFARSARRRVTSRVDEVFGCWIGR
jgi:hypothetical protein